MTITPYNITEGTFYHSMAPAAAAAVTFAVSRGAAGALGLSINKATSYMGQNQISEILNQTGNSLKNFATRNAELECKIVAGLFGIGTLTYYTTNILSNELKLIAPEQEISRLKKITEYIGLTQPLTSSEHFVNVAERVSTQVSENPTILVNAPTGTLLTASLSSRAVAGLVGIGCKITGETLNLVGFKNIGQPISETSDNLVDFAKRNLSTEQNIVHIVQFGKMLGQGAFWIGRGVSSIGRGVSSIGQSILSYVQ